MRPGSRGAALAKRQADGKVLRRLARQAEREQLATVLAGPHGAALRDLRRFLRGLRVGDGRALVAHVEASALRGADERICVIALRLIGEAIARARSSAGLDPLDDPLPGQPRSARQMCADLLRGRP